MAGSQAADLHEACQRAKRRTLSHFKRFETRRGRVWRCRHENRKCRYRDKEFQV